MYEKQMEKCWKIWHDDIPVQLIPEPNISYCRGFAYGLKAIQDHVVSWHKKTFPNATKQAIVDKLCEESGELSDAETSEDMLDELADVVIVGASLCESMGVNLHDIIYKKMQTNKHRKWGKEEKDGNRLRIK